MSNGKVSSKDRIAIPKEVREEVGLRPGDKVAVESRDGATVVRRLKNPSETMVGIGKSTQEKLGNIPAVELIRKMRKDD
ncbi:MAG: AbrB/MazE/SpoVT family DNA-binding domain-containing protein [Thermoproteota archaeon]